MLVVVAPAAAAIVLFHPVASPSLAMRRSQGSGVSPGHKLIDAAGGPAVDELGQHICEPSVRIDVAEAANRDGAQHPRSQPHPGCSLR